jgi:hypothetical protein
MFIEDLLVQVLAASWSAVKSKRCNDTTHDSHGVWELRWLEEVVHVGRILTYDIVESLKNWEEYCSAKLGLAQQQSKVLVEIGGPRLVERIEANDILVVSEMFADDIPVGSKPVLNSGVIVELLKS